MEKLELAVTVVRVDFGPVVASVCRALLLHPGLRHSEIAERCAAPTPGAHALDDALAVLLSHGLAVAEAHPASAGSAAQRAVLKNERQLTTDTATGGLATNNAKRSRTRLGDGDVPDGTVLFFKMHMDRVLLRIRNGRFLRIAQYQFGNDGKRIARLLIQRGRLTAADIIKVEYPNAEKLEIDEIERTMITMVKSGLLRWAGSAELGPVSAGIVKVICDDDEGGPAQEKVGGKSGHGGDAGGGNDWRDDDEDSDNPSGRQGSTDDVDADVTMAELDPLNPAYNSETKKVRVGQGFNARLVSAPLRGNSVDAWMLCTWYCNKVLYNSCCSSVVVALLGGKQRMEDRGLLMAYKVFRAGLNIVSRMEDRDVITSWDETGETRLDDIQDELNTGGMDTNDVDFRDAVQTLLHVTPAIARAVPEHAPEALVFYTGKLIAMSRRQTIDDTLRDKHTITGLRVWRALALHGCMQEKMISDKTMLVVKTVREYLYKLLRDGFVSMQEVPKSSEPVRADRVAAVWYLWRADFEVVVKRLVCDSLRTTRRIMLKIEELKASPLDDEPDAETKRAAGLKLLEATVYRCDDLVMLLRDFGPLTDAAFESLYRTEADFTQRRA
jgi:hypothetical protein